MCRSRRELSNAYFLAKFGFDTAENEPSKVCRIPGLRGGARAAPAELATAALESLSGARLSLAARSDAVHHHRTPNHRKFADLLTSFAGRRLLLKFRVMFIELFDENVGMLMF